MKTIAVDNDAYFLSRACDMAERSLQEGGIPIGAVLVHGATVIGAGHNMRVQEGSLIKHAEMACLEDAGRQAKGLRESTLYTTLSPCIMCAGAIALYGIPRVVIADNENFAGEIDFLLSRGVQVDVWNLRLQIEKMANFISNNQELWNEDIGG